MGPIDFNKANYREYICLPMCPPKPWQSSVFSLKALRGILRNRTPNQRTCSDVPPELADAQSFAGLRLCSTTHGKGSCYPIFFEIDLSTVLRQIIPIASS